MEKEKITVVEVADTLEKYAMDFAGIDYMSENFTVEANSSQSGG